MNALPSESTWSPFVCWLNSYLLKGTTAGSLHRQETEPGAEPPPWEGEHPEGSTLLPRLLQGAQAGTTSGQHFPMVRGSGFALHCAYPCAGPYRHPPPRVVWGTSVLRRCSRPSERCRAGQPPLLPMCLPGTPLGVKRCLLSQAFCREWVCFCIFIKWVTATTGWQPDCPRGSC